MLERGGLVSASARFSVTRFDLLAEIPNIPQIFNEMENLIITSSGSAATSRLNSRFNSQPDWLIRINSQPDWSNFTFREP